MSDAVVPPIAVRFEGVSKVFPGTKTPAVDDCTLSIEKGCFVVLLGPSGCGKTTLLKMVNRLYEPTAGTIYIDGVSTRSLDVTQLRRRIGYVIQQGGLFPHMTVAQNVAVVPKLLGWSHERIAARVEELLSLVDLPPEQYGNRYPSQLSGGQQQRVGVARALASDPELILMDEPFGALDAITRFALQDELAGLQRRLRKTILFVTHDVDEALRLADRIAVLRSGRLVQYGSPLEILRHPAHEFVQQLLGANDLVRILNLLPVASVMRPLPAIDVTNPAGSSLLQATIPTIDADDTLRAALDSLLRSGVQELVVQEKGVPCGVVSYSDLAAIADQRTNR